MYLGIGSPNLIPRIDRKCFSRDGFSMQVLRNQPSEESIRAVWQSTNREFGFWAVLLHVVNWRAGTL